MVLHDLSIRYKGFGSFRDHVGFAHSCASTDVGSLANFSSAAVTLWRECSSPSSSISTYAGFKHQLAKEFPFAGKLLAPMRDAIELFFEDRDPNTFYPVYQAFSFPTHLSLVDIDLSTALEEEYLEQESRLAALRLYDPLIEQMNGVMRGWFRGFRFDPVGFTPQHGPGGVAELPGDRSLYSKYEALAPDELLRYWSRKHIGVDADEYVPHHDYGSCGKVTTTRQSRIVFVPKSMKTKRVISMEPATLMYFQQGVDRCVRNHVARHRFLSSRIDFNNQSLQRQAALDASSTREFATVDLSAASDSVSWNLVKRVFRGTGLLSSLWALRSTSTVLPSGRVVALAKFAPMGSSLTFPIETLIFACIAECTNRYVYATTGVSDSRFRVYGDDIIVPDACLSDLESNLRLCGFRINEDKTYAGDHKFRESCGCDAYDGVDVSPMRIGRNFSADRITPRTPGVFAAIIDMANTAHAYDFRLLRRYLVDKLVNGTVLPPLFSGDGKHGVLSSSPDNYRLKERWDCDFQRFEVQASGLSTARGDISPGFIAWDSVPKCYAEDAALLAHCDDDRYFEWLRAANLRSPDLQCDLVAIDEPRRHIGSETTCLSKRWFNKPPETCSPPA